MKQEDLLKTHTGSTGAPILSTHKELPQTVENTFPPRLLELSADQQATAEELSRLVDEGR